MWPQMTSFPMSPPSCSPCSVVLKPEHQHCPCDTDMCDVCGQKQCYVLLWPHKFSAKNKTQLKCPPIYWALSSAPDTPCGATFDSYRFPAPGCDVHGMSTALFISLTPTFSWSPSLWDAVLQNSSWYLLRIQGSIIAMSCPIYDQDNVIRTCSVRFWNLPRYLRS